MKQIVILQGMMIVIILSSLIILTVQNRIERLDELNRAVSMAVRQTVSDSQQQNQKEISSNEEMIAHFAQILSLGIKSDGDISMEIMGVDYQRGLLDIRVSETFDYPNGKRGHISIRKCAIYG